MDSSVAHVKMGDPHQVSGLKHSDLVALKHSGLVALPGHGEAPLPTAPLTPLREPTTIPFIEKGLDARRMVTCRHHVELNQASRKLQWFAREAGAIGDHVDSALGLTAGEQ